VGGPEQAECERRRKNSVWSQKQKEQDPPLLVLTN